MGQKTHPKGFRVGIIRPWDSTWYANFKDYAANVAEDAKIRKFIKTLRSSDAYYWREIAGTNRKSFHSYGIAIDLLPQRLNGRSIYWGWEKERSGDKWMMVPQEARWAPPQALIKIFEEHGFIWGGYWIIFDNMHFEYQPQLIQ